MYSRKILKSCERDNFLNTYLNPTLIIQAYPENPKHPKQKCHLTNNIDAAIDRVKKKKQQKHYCRICDFLF